VPGRYLARAIDGKNPGVNHLRLSLVPAVEECREAALRLRELLLTT
jgi:N-succinyldiaminopimelate aminotransferase